MSRGGTPRGGAPSTRAVGVIALCLIPVGLIVALIASRSVNVPYSDEWALVPLLKKQAVGTLRLSDLWAQHNEHRSFFPQLILVKLSRLTLWDLRWELVVNFVFALGVFAVIMLLLRGTLKHRGRWLYAVGVVAATWLLFSPIQWENWLSGWQNAWFLSELAVLGALAVLCLWPAGKPVWSAVGLAIVLGGLGSYSLASGLLVWPCALLVFLARPRLKRWLPVWVLAGVIALIVYLIGYHKPLGSPPLGYAIQHPFSFCLFLLAYLGTPLWGRQRLAVPVGLGVGLLFVVFLGSLFIKHRRVLADEMVWLAIAAYGVLGELLTALARAGYGVSQGTASRYTTADLMIVLPSLVLGLIAVQNWAESARGTRLAVVVPAALIVLVVAGLARSYQQGVKGADHYQAVELQGQTCMARATPADHSCLDVLIANNADYAFTQLQYLRSAGLAGQHPPSAAPAAASVRRQ